MRVCAVANLRVRTASELTLTFAKKNLQTTFLFALLLFLTGCLEIDGPDVTLRYDAEQDRIDVMFVHRGIFAGGSEGGSEPLQAAKKDLEQALETGRFAFWNNWPLSCDPSKDYDAVRNTLLQHVEVENGGLFTDLQGTLCGYQFVRVNKVSTFLKKLNTMLELGLQAACVTGIPQLGNRKLDEDSKDLIREFLRSREPFLTLEQGRIELRLPISRKDQQWVKKAIGDRLMDSMPREIIRREAVAQRRQQGLSPTDTGYSVENTSIQGSVLRQEIERAPSYRFFWDNDFTFQRTADLSTFGIGVAGDDNLQIKKSMGGMYHEAFLLQLRKDNFDIEDGMPDQELIRRFEAFLGRDAKLPRKLAEKRA